MKLLAWGTLAVIASWSIWYFVERFSETRCYEDGCPIVLGHSPTAERVAHWVLWLLALAFAARAAGMPDRTPRRVGLAAGLAASCFIALLVTLGGVFPPLPPMIPGE